jgi:stress-induced-phosphoprotein 1
VARINEVQTGDDPERSARAMADPEIQQILRDPMVSAAIQDIQRDPRAAAKVMADPGMAAKIQKLVAAGVLQVR